MDANPDNTPIFRRVHDEEDEEASSDGADVFVLGVTVNKPNTRFAIIFYEPETQTEIVRLWTVLSKEVLWEKKSTRTDDKDVQIFISPTFTDDGQWMGHYYEGRVEVVDARSGQTMDLISLTKHRSKLDSTWNPDAFEPTAIALANNRKRIAAAATSPTQPDYATSLAVGIFDQGENRTCQVDVVWTTKLDNVGLVYMMNGRLLFAAGKLDYWKNQWGCCWDTKTRSQLFVIKIIEHGYYDSFRGTPIYTTIFSKEPCVIMRLAYPQSHRPSGLKVYSRRGVCLVDTLGDQMAVHTITHNGVLSLNSDSSLQFWGDGKNGLKVATLADENFPDFFEVKGMSVTEYQITLIMDDERFIVFKKDP